MIIDTMIDTSPTQWWEEEELVFDGVPATAYLWPRDRLILFYREPDQSGMDIIQEQSMIVPTFHIDTVDGTLRDQIREAVKYAKFDNPHIHVIRVDGLLEYGIIVGDKKLKPVTDCWADSEARKNRTLDRQMKWKMENEND